MFTREELEAAHKCALNYPPGHGNSFFYDKKYSFVSSAFERIKNDLDCIKFG